jgi:hypothetical protein
MSYGVKYIAPFYDILGHEWYPVIEEEGHTGVLTSLQASGSPLTFDYMADADDLFESPVRATKADLTIKASGTFDDLFTSDDMNLRMKVFEGVPLLTGWTNDGTNPFETLTTSGKSITSAINSAGGNGVAVGTTFTVTTGEKILVFCKHTLNSGSAGRLLLINSGWTLEDSHSLTSGWNLIEFTAAWTGDAKIIAYRDNNLATNFSLTDVYVFRESQLYFSGYVTPDSYSESYSDTPFDITVSATDGLGYLNDIDFDDSGTAYEGRMQESDILLEILAKIGYTEFSEIVNIYETRMDDGTGDSPLDQVFIDAEIFKDMTCYEALEYLLIKWNALIRQYHGRFYIYRPQEMITTAYVRRFTDVNTKTEYTINPLMEFNRSTSSSYIRDTNGGVRMKKAPVKKLTIIQDYGWRESWIKTWEFKGEDFDGSDFSNWTRSAGTTVSAISSILAGEKDGCLIDQYDTSAPYAYYIEQEFAPYAIESYPGDILGFSFEFLFYNSGASQVTGKYFFIEITQGSYWLQVGADDNVDWNTGTVSPMLFGIDAPVGSSGWTKVEKTGPFGIAATGPITIKIFGPNDSNLKVAIKNVRFYAYSVEVAQSPSYTKLDKPIKGGRRILPSFAIVRQIYTKEYEVTNALQGKEVEFEQIMGDALAADVGIDNVIEQFAGSLGIISLSLTAIWFVIEWAATYLSGGVIVTSSGADIVFTAQTAGTDFDGSTTITNVSGDLDGTVVNTVANVVGVQQVDECDLTGSTFGDLDFTVGGTTKNMQFNLNIQNTIDAFITAEAATYLANEDVVLTRDGNKLVVTGNAYNSFTSSFVNNSGDITMTITTVQTAVTPVARVDTVTLTGRYGTANILCDGTTKLADTQGNVQPSEAWDTRGGSENDPLLELIGGEYGYQTSRQRQMLQVPIREFDDHEIHIIPIGCFTDDLNLDADSNPCIFAFNRGVFEVKNRKWDIDMIEIVND